MIASFTRLRHSRFARGLALLALLAHLGLGIASGAHHARMLANGLDTWAEVCTPFGIERLPLFDDRDPSIPDAPSVDVRLADCVVCATAGLLAAPPGGLPTAGVPAHDAAPPPSATPASIAPRTELRPPSRAPPSIS